MEGTHPGDPVHGVPFCSAASPEATRRGLMASGICHLMQSTFHQCQPCPAAGATRLITPGSGAGQGAAHPSLPPCSSSSSPHTLLAQVGASARCRDRDRDLMQPDREQMAAAIRLKEIPSGPEEKHLSP